MLFRFKMATKKTDFYFTSFRFWPNFEKTLSQKNFSMKFGSKKENMNSITLLKQNFLKVISFQNGGQNKFLTLCNNANLC